MDRTFSGALVAIDAAGALAASLSYEEALRLSSNSSSDGGTLSDLGLDGLIIFVNENSTPSCPLGK